MYTLTILLKYTFTIFNIRQDLSFMTLDVVGILWRSRFCLQPLG